MDLGQREKRPPELLHLGLLDLVVVLVLGVVDDDGDLDGRGAVHAGAAGGVHAGHVRQLLLVLGGGEKTR